MMASAIAIETFFSTCGDCASAGEVARTDSDASTARRTRRMLLASLKVMVSRLVEPSLALINPARAVKFASLIGAGADVGAHLWAKRLVRRSSTGESGSVPAIQNTARRWM